MARKSVQIFLFAFVFVIVQQINAQNATLLSVFRGIDIFNLWWSPDSSQLYFQYVGTDYNPFSSVSQPVSWYSYNLPSNTGLQITPPPSFGIQINTEMSVDQARTSINSIFMSPNQQFIVSAGTPISINETLFNLLGATTFNHQIEVVDRNSSQSISTGVPIIASTLPDTFRIQWSGNSERFTVSDSAVLLNDFLSFHYVSGYAQDIPVVDVTNLQNLESSQGQFDTREIFQLSLNGNLVLLRAALDNTVGSYTRLGIWDATTEQTRIIEQVDASSANLLWAAFDSENTSNIYAITQQGLIQINRSTEQLTVLDAAINSTQFEQALFSPDGRYIALVGRVNGAEYEVYLYAVQ